MVGFTAMLACASLGAADGRVSSALQASVQQEGYVTEHGISIYYKAIGRGRPLMILHGGPGGSHDAFLPYLLPLAVQHRLVFIDERGSGRSSRPPGADSYTLAAMTNDVDVVRRALHLGRIDLLGHSFGGILAQAYAIAYPRNVIHLILASTWLSAERINTDFAKIRTDADPGIMAKIDALESRDIFDAGGAQLPEYRKLADAVEGRYIYFVHRPAWDEPTTSVGWEILRTMWCGRSDFHVDGNLTGFDFAAALSKLDVKSLIIAGDHDLLQPETAAITHRSIHRSTLILIPNSGHMSFVDQPETFLEAVSQFLN